MLGGMGVNNVGVITIDGVYVGVIVAISVRVGFTCRAIVATEPTGFWPVVWVGVPDILGRLQPERTPINARDIDRSLNVFNFAFLVAMKIYFGIFLFTRACRITTIHVCYF